jgi:hypothetical protein
MIHRKTRRFDRAFEALHPDVQRKAIEAFRLFRKDPRHPSLRVEKLAGTAGIWAGHVTLHVVWTFEYKTDSETGKTICIHRTIGSHNHIYRKP